MRGSPFSSSGSIFRSYSIFQNFEKTSQKDASFLIYCKYHISHILIHYNGAKKGNLSFNIIMTLEQGETTEKQWMTLDQSIFKTIGGKSRINAFHPTLQNTPSLN